MRACSFELSRFSTDKKIGVFGSGLELGSVLSVTKRTLPPQ